MNLNIAREVAALRRLSTRELRAKYAEVFGDVKGGHLLCHFDGQQGRWP